MIYVILQFGLFFYLLSAIAWHNTGVVFWLLNICGIGLGLWAIFIVNWKRLSVFPHVNERTRFTERGPYRVIRHPMYAALMLCVIAFWLTNPAWIVTLALVALMAVIHFKIEFEERQLIRHFPEYEAYRQRTRRIVPFIY